MLLANDLRHSFRPRLPQDPALALGACGEGGEKSALKSLRSPYRVDSKFAERRSCGNRSVAGKFVQRLVRQRTPLPLGSSRTTCQRAMRGSATLINVVRSLMRPASDRFADFGLSPSRPCWWQGLLVRQGLPGVREGDGQMPLSARRNRLSAPHAADRDPTEEAGEPLDASQLKRRLGVEDEDIGKHAEAGADGDVVAAVEVEVERGDADTTREARDTEET